MNLLTFDIEEWYIYEKFPKGGKDYYLPIINNYLENILNILDQKEYKATFFCLGNIARQQPEIIKKIANRGHEIGCHSDEHNLVTDLDPKQFKDDTGLAIDSLQQLVGKKVNMYRAPAFSITENNKWALEVLIECGIEYDSSIFPANHRFGGFKNLNLNKPSFLETKSGLIKEFPINYITIGNKRIMYSGGGYFRLIPYPLINYFTRKSDYNMAYFHIRDLDKYQKIVKSANYFYSYYGIKNAYKKLEKYLNDFNFISLGQSDSLINWQTAPKFII